MQSLVIHLLGLCLLIVLLQVEFGAAFQQHASPISNSVPTHQQQCRNRFHNNPTISIKHQHQLVGPLHVLLDEQTQQQQEGKAKKTKNPNNEQPPNSLLQVLPKNGLLVQRDQETADNKNNNNDDNTILPLNIINDDDQLQKRTMLALCWGVACLSALDRVAMSVAMVPLSAEYGYTDTVKGAVSSLFSVGYGLAIIPAGILVATASPRIAMACGIGLWSLATLATPYAAAASNASSSMAILLMARASVGAAESLVVPTIQRLLSSWTTPNEKSASLALVFSGFHAGTVGAYILSPIIIDSLGDWRNIFLVYGGMGLFWLIPWLALSRDAPSTQQQQQQTNSLLLPLQEEEEDTRKQWAKSISSLKEAPWGDFIRSKGSWAMLLAHCANNWGLYNTLAWSPTFYSEQYGLNVKDSALLSVLPSVAGAIGGLLAGNLADNLLQNIHGDTSPKEREQKITNIRKGFQGSALLVPALALATLSSHIPEYPWMAQGLLMGTTGFQAFNAAGYLAANQEKAGPKWAGLLYSVTSLPAVMTGTLGVYATGRVLDLTQQDWSLVFALNAGINLLGAASFVALYDSKREFD